MRVDSNAPALKIKNLGLTIIELPLLLCAITLTTGDSVEIFNLFILTTVEFIQTEIRLLSLMALEKNLAKFLVLNGSQIDKRK